MVWPPSPPGLVLTIVLSDLSDTASRASQSPEKAPFSADLPEIYMPEIKNSESPFLFLSNNPPLSIVHLECTGTLQAHAELSQLAPQRVLRGKRGRAGVLCGERKGQEVGLNLPLWQLEKGEL